MYDLEKEKSNPEVASVEGADGNQPSSSEKAVEQFPETNHTTPVQELADLGSDTDDPPKEMLTQEPDVDVEDIELKFRQLAELPEIEYYRCRIQEAKQLGITSSELDKLVKPYKSTAEPNTSTEMFPQVEQWHETVDGAKLLFAIVALIERFIDCERHITQTAALWIMFSWCIKVMKIAPIACITAPAKRCGKTQLLSVMSRLCLNSLKTSNITTAALFRSIEKYKPTLFIDEADSFLKQNEEMRGVLNEGFEVGGCVTRTVGENHDPTKFNVFCAKVICGIGHLSETLNDRSIFLELRRKGKDEHRERLRHANPAEFDEIQRKLARWAEDNMDALQYAQPDLPEALDDRAQDRWESLLAIADQVGGEWSQIARDAALKMSVIDEQSLNVTEELLMDIKKAFESVGAARLSTAQLLDMLCQDEEAKWATFSKGKLMTARDLSVQLRDFGIKSSQIRFGDKTLKGYELSDFNDTFTRYL